MCIVIDTCVFSDLLCIRSLNHEQFKPVLDWIMNGKGKFVYGGTRYRYELKLAKRYHRLLNEFKRAGKVVEIDDDKIDNISKELERTISDPDFDDAHIMAILIASQCKLVCTNDTRSIPFLRKSSIYPRGMRHRPKIYSHKANSDLLCDKNIAECCKPCIKFTKNKRNDMGNLLIK